MCDTRKCRTCEWILPLECFGFDVKHGKRYRRYKCEECRKAEAAARRRMAKYRAFNELARWPAPTNQE